MGYQYDVFVSYRREALTKAWIDRIFIPILSSHIFDELGRDPIFYIDSQLEAGTTWPIALGKALGSSRTMITLWSKTYLNSEWCSSEISHMLQREVNLGFRSVEKPNGLVFPTVIHDGETMPINLTSIQKFEIIGYWSKTMSLDSPNAELLEDKLKPLGKAIASAIEREPSYKDDWQIEAANAFYQQLYQKIEASQNQTPKFTQQ